MQREARRQRFSIVALVVGVLLAVYVVHRFWTRELWHLTGPAEWMWVTDELERVHSESALFVGSLVLEAPASSALLKICGDREYVAYVNGSPAACGWSRPGFRLDLYDIAHLLRQGTNVIAVEVRSPTPVGGLLLALDVEGVGRNVLVSGPALVARSHFSLLMSDPSDAPAPVIWGLPPRFPWGYPKPLSHPRTLDETVVEDGVRIEGPAARPLDGGGWEFALPRPVRGYIWLEFTGDGAAFMLPTNDEEASDVAALRALAQPAVRVRGQRRWLDPEPHVVSHVWVFCQRRPLAVEVWPMAEEVSSVAPGVVPGSFGPVPRTRWTTRTPPG